MLAILESGFLILAFGLSDFAVLILKSGFLNSESWDFGVWILEVLILDSGSWILGFGVWILDSLDFGAWSFEFGILDLGTVVGGSSGCGGSGGGGGGVGDSSFLPLRVNSLDFVWSPGGLKLREGHARPN